MQKTLGGDRLGSGKKMKVELHGYERSTHDLSYLWRSTMASGTLVPFLCEVALPGDTFDIDLQSKMLTHPTIGPLFGTYKAQFDVFQAPIRLYNSLLHNNALGIGLNMSKVKLPQIEMLAGPENNPKDLDNSQINPSCIFSYLGIRGIGRNRATDLSAKTRYFNAVPYLAYWDIYKNYYANKQEEIGAVIHATQTIPVKTITEITIYDASTPLGSIPLAPTTVSTYFTSGYVMEIQYTGADPVQDEIVFNTNIGPINARDLCLEFSFLGGGYIAATINDQKYPGVYLSNYRYLDSTDVRQNAPEVHTFPLENIDTMRKNILAYSSEVTPFKVTATSPEPYKLPLTATFWQSTLNTQEGLGIKTYQSDLFNNWIQTEWIDGAAGINAITAIDTTDGNFTLDTLNLSKKVYDMLNRIAVSGGTYQDWLDAVYTHETFFMSSTPMYMGGLSKEVVFQEVVSNAASNGQELGTIAGKGSYSDKHKGGSIYIKVNEPSYIIGIVSLTPRVDYSQGNKWDVHLATMDDLHKPALDEIGFQELITEQMAWWDTEWDEVKNDWVTKSAGKQPAWLNYMTNVNQVRGNFAIQDNEMFMTLNRRYEADTNGIKDLTTYIDPSKFNFIFAETSIDAQNFWCQIAVNITARRKMSAKVMPNL